ncbi:MAG: RNA polymerase subunit sigma-70 [Betaproteobacteria bacterium]|nr:RNA polymerase subunit sigma-70 [Betaproteobacteria bacterium]
MSKPEAPLARNVKRLSHVDLPGAGQVYVIGNHAYIGHVPNAQKIGTSILDVSDPGKPRITSQILIDDPESHSHKVRVIGDIMIVNHERNMSAIGRRADELPRVRASLRQALGRDPRASELAQELGVKESDMSLVEAAERTVYANGGFKIYDIADKAEPRLITYQKTGGIGVHRFDMDANYAYISTEMAGYVGNILVIYDLRNPVKPQEVARWWMPGQHVAGGEIANPEGRRHRLHHALRFGNELWASCWLAGVRVIDVSDIRAPRTLGQFNYHPPFPEPTHTVMPLPSRIAGRRIAVAIDEEEQAQSPEDMERRRGRPHGCLWVLDASDVADMKPLAMFEVSELDSPWSRATLQRFGAHQFQEHIDDTLVYCAWFAGGLRIIDVADPFAPQEVGHFIPEPATGKAAPQTNDVDTDTRGLVYIVDRHGGFDILEFARR